MPYGFCAEMFPDPERDPVWHLKYTGHPVPRDGKITPPAEPGLGIQLDWDFVERYRIA